MESIIRFSSDVVLVISGLAASYFLLMWIKSPTSWRKILVAAFALLFGVGTQVFEAHSRAPGMFVGDMPRHLGIVFVVFACITCVIGVWLALKERNADILAMVTVTLLIFGVLFGSSVLAYWESGSHERLEPKSGMDALLKVLEG